MYADWFADEIWCLHWTVRTTAHGLLLELATLLALGQRIAGALRRRGHTPAVAAAEAVTILELGRDSEPWRQLRAQLPR